jgi:hypothetical protein
MTKIIDYTKTIFYKIVCNDLNIKDCYIGHTTNFKKRMPAHKNGCNNENNINYNLNVYKFIRDNGGWCNWSMIMIEEIQCDNKLDALRQERKFIEEYQATLNNKIPSRPKQEYNKERYQHNKNKLNKQMKEYREKNKDKIKEYQKEYYEDNKNKVLNYQKEYREINKDKMNERNKEYYEANKEDIQLKNSQKIYCDCCKVNIRKGDISRHYKSNKHIKASK